MKQSKYLLVVLGVFQGLLMCLFTSACSPTEPKNGDNSGPEPTATLIWQIDSHSLGLNETPAQIKCRFLQSGQVYAEKLLSAQASEVMIADLNLGAQTLEIEMLDGAGMLIAKAESDLDLQAGRQTLSQELIFVTRQLYQARLALELAEPLDDQYNYTDHIAPILANNDYSCLSCHTGSAAYHVDLTSFPFQSDKYQDDQTQIVDSIISRVGLPQGNGQRMPMGNQPSLTAQEIQIFNTWKENGLPGSAVQCDEPSDVIAEIKISYSLSGATREDRLQADDNGNFNWQAWLFPDELPETYHFVLLGPDGQSVVNHSNVLAFTEGNLSTLTLLVPCL